MRECIYCGKQLEKGEKCTCAMSVAKRLEKERAEAAANAENPAHSADSAKTDKGEKKREKARQKAEKQRKKEQARAEKRQARADSAYSDGTGRINKNAFADVWRKFVMFVKNPVETTMNPGSMTKAEIMIFVVIEGILNGLCVYSAVTGTGRGPFRLLGNLLGFRGLEGFGTIAKWLLAAFSGAIAGLLLFFILTGIFYFITKTIFHQFVTYWGFSKRFAFVAIPSTIIGAVGVILGFFSQTTLTVLLLCGLTGSVVLVYEILRAMWSSKSASKTLYAMMCGMFVFILAVNIIMQLSFS